MKRLTALLAVLIVLALPATSLGNGGGSNCQAYNPQLCGAVDAGSSNHDASGTLPFTGINVGLLTVLGASFLGAGLVVRRFARDIS